MQRRRLEIALLGLLCALSAGCASERAPPSGRLGDAHPAVVPAAADRWLRSMAEASPGETFTIPARVDSGQVNVIVEREYHAASGRLCRRLRIDGADRVACREPLGSWQLLPPLTNQALPILSTASRAASR